MTIGFLDRADRQRSGDCYVFATFLGYRMSRPGCKLLNLNEPCRTRTCDPLVKSQLLYHLS
jgi:hypothetical protein